MPYTVTHILVPLILIGLYRDYIVRKKFPLYYVFIGGIAGILPDLDVLIFYFLSFFGVEFTDVHRTFSHTLFLPLIFVILGLLTFNVGKRIRKHNLKLNTLFYMIAFGSFIHLILDAIFSGQIMPFYPLSYHTLGFNIVDLAPFSWRPSLLPILDAILLILWLCYLEIKHKISDFV